MTERELRYHALSKLFIVRTVGQQRSRTFHSLPAALLALGSVRELPVIAQASLARENSRGAHYREDFPDEGDLVTSYFTVVRKAGDGLDFQREPVDFSIVRPGETILPEGEPETLVAAE